MNKKIIEIDDRVDIPTYYERKTLKNEKNAKLK